MFAALSVGTYGCSDPPAQTTQYETGEVVITDQNGVPVNDLVVDEVPTRVADQQAANGPADNSGQAALQVEMYGSSDVATGPGSDPHTSDEANPVKAHSIE